MIRNPTTLGIATALALAATLTAAPPAAAQDSLSGITPLLAIQQAYCGTHSCRIQMSDACGLVMQQHHTDTANDTIILDYFAVDRELAMNTGMIDNPEATTGSVRILTHQAALECGVFQDNVKGFDENGVSLPDAPAPDSAPATDTATDNEAPAGG